MADTTVDRIQQINTLRTLSATNTFAQSLIRQFDAHGCLTLPQWKRVTEMATGTQSRPRLNFAAIIAIFRKAQQSALKYPKIRLHTPNGEICLGLAGSRSKAPGTINVTNGGSYGGNTWYGRINTDGTFTATKEATDEIVAMLQRFSDDPIRVASEYGRLTGNCCFCGRSLKDERSTDVGYGPICAEKFGLSWGTT